MHTKAHSVKVDPHFDSSSALATLSSAGDEGRRRERPPRKIMRRTSFMFAAVIGILAGAALIFAGRFEHTCAATFRLPATDASAGALDYQTALLAVASQHDTEMVRAGMSTGGWSVDAPNSDQLRLRMRTMDSAAGLTCLRKLAKTYKTHVRELAEASRAIPSPVETALSTAIAEFNKRMDTQRLDVETAQASLTDSDPSMRRTALLGRWKDARTALLESRTRLQQASDDFSRLREEAAPTHGLVPAEERRLAIIADAALQQDLAELAVNLTELKLHLLNVWQESAGSLERLMLAASELTQVISSSRVKILWDEHRTKTPPLVSMARGYHQALTAFTESWNREFTTAQRLKIDAYQAEMIRIFERSRRRLNDFLFEAAKRLASMRSTLQSMAVDSSNNVRFYVAQAGLTRAFAKVQTAHHRFEFSAGAIETPDNFRIDAATRAARGLMRRSRQQLRQIDRRLQAKAAKRASVEHRQAISEAEQRVAMMRHSSDRAVDELLALQDQLHLNANMDGEFVRGRIALEHAKARLEVTRDYLDHAQQRRAKLAAERATSGGDFDVELLSCGVIDAPARLRRCLTLGGLTAGLTMMAVLFGQWWITRRI